MHRRIVSLNAFAAVFLMHFVLFAGKASGQTFEVVASQFGPLAERGTHPNAGLIRASDGNYYGTTYAGGEFGYGTVFKIEPNGTTTIVHSFGNTDGANPSAPVIEGVDGNLYGTTLGGGVGGVGTVFSVGKDGSGFVVLHSLSAQDPVNGCFPEGSGIRAPLVLGADGLYGVVASGGCTPNAAFFRIDPSGADRFHIIGYIPDTGADSGLVRGADGFFYGTSLGADFGRIYRISGQGSAEVLHTLTREEGFAHYSTELIQAADGKLYGTAESGGDPSCGLESCGTVFWFDPVTLEYHRMHAFTLDDPAGRYPIAGLVEGSDGLLYGTTAVTTPSGADCCGAIFRIDPSTDQVTVLHTFVGDSAGASPRGRLIEASPGEFLGTAYWGGVAGDSGVAFRLTLETATSTGLSVSAPAAVFGQQVTFTAPVSSAAGVPTGQVRFLDGSTVLGTATLANGEALLATSSLAVGVHSISAEYLGDGGLQPSASSSVPVTVSRAETITTLGSSPNPSSRKQVVTLTATIVPVAPGDGTATGQVQFMEGKKKLGTAPLVNGVATLQVTFNGMGTHDLTATYGGDGNFVGGVSAVFTHTVNK